MYITSKQPKKKKLPSILPEGYIQQHRKSQCSRCNVFNKVLLPRSQIAHMYEAQGNILIFWRSFSYMTMN